MALASRPKSFFNLFPPPEYLLLSTSGVAIADKGIKFVEFHRGIIGDKLKITHSSKTVLPPGVVEAGSIKDAGALSLALKDLSSRYSLSYIHATLPEERAYLFTATIERVPAEGLRDAVAFIVEENAPVSLPDSVFDFEVIDLDPASTTLKVVVSVLPRNVIASYIAAFESAGMTPISFDIESQAIARTIIPEGDRRTQLIINWGEKRTGFYVVEDEVVQFSTTPIHGLLAQESVPNLHDLKAEMGKVFAFWNTRADKQGVSARPIERVLLCGAAVTNASMVADLMSECVVPH
ncbi:MAG: pilus assembly protein PilM, partial [bacterium]|nr:pilus assembly protein PilM [bacterium]